MNNEEKKAWEIYLKKQQAQAHRSALKKAVIGEPPPPESRRGSIDGKGTVQIIFVPPPGVEPWTFDDEDDDPPAADK